MFEDERIVMIKRLALLALSLSLVFLPGAIGLPDEAVGRVVSVISGDSMGINMLIVDGEINSVDRIKLADIAVPSTITAEGKAAQNYALSLLKNKMVYLDINSNASGRRNKWNQLICVIYLVDSEFRPVWPPVNRILVDSGYARLNDDPDNEFNSSAWWLQPPVFLPSKKRDLLTDMLEKMPQSKEMFFAGPLPSPANVAKVNSQLNASGNVSASNATKSILAESATNSTLATGAAKGKPESDKVRKTSMLDAKKAASTLSATKGRAASIAVPDNSTSCIANGTSLSSGVPVNSTSHIAMKNTTASKMQINSTTLVVPGVSESGTTKKDPRSVSILEKDKTSGRISIGYRE
jgi:hypothetical protein